MRLDSLISLRRDGGRNNASHVRQVGMRSMGAGGQGQGRGLREATLSFLFGRSTLTKVKNNYDA